MVQIRWTEQAKSDLKEIYDYIAHDSRKFAQRQVIRIKLKTRLLKDNPTIGRMVPEINDPMYRELIEGNYRIIHKLKPSGQIDIITIHHASRDLRNREL